MLTIEQVKRYSRINLSGNRVRLFYVKDGCLGKWEEKPPIDWGRFTMAINKRNNLTEDELMTEDEFRGYINTHFQELL